MRELKVMNENNRRATGKEGYYVYDFISESDAIDFWCGTDMQVYLDDFDYSIIYVADNKSTHEVISMSVYDLKYYIYNLMKEMEA